MIARIAGFAAFALALVLLLMHNTGTIKAQAEINGVQAQTIVQKEQAIAQARQLAAEAEMERDRAEAQRKADIEAMSLRLAENQEALSRANERLARFAEAEETDEDYKAWAAIHHPGTVNRLLNDPAASVGPTRADRAHGDEGGRAAGGFDSVVPDE